MSALTLRSKAQNLLDSLLSATPEGADLRVELAEACEIIRDLAGEVSKMQAEIAVLKAQNEELNRRTTGKPSRRYHPDGADITGEASAHIAEHYRLEPNEGQE